MLILASEEVVAALLGMMVELQGFRPKFPAKTEAVEDLILRERPRAVIVDCDHPDCVDEILEAIKQTGALPILFSPFRLQAEVTSVAARHGVRSFTLPTDVDTFARVLS